MASLETPQPATSQPATSQTENKHLVIGAGFVGLGMAKAMIDANLPFDHVEATSSLGGNWKHGVYNHVHIISSKKTTEFTNYPMPNDFPDFPSASQMYTYLKAYAQNFNLAETIQIICVSSK